MLKGTNANWTVKRLVKEIKNNNVTFDNAVQRTLVWTNDQKSLLIDSLLNGYPVPQMYANKDSETKVLDMLDGKQRSNALLEYLNDEFDLTEIVSDTTTDSGEEVSVEGMKFSELPQELQDRIYDFTINIVVYDDMSDDEISEVFRRLNNGKALSAIELTRVKAKSLQTIQEIGQNAIFTHALSEKALAKYGQEEIVMKAYALLFTENPSFETKFIRPLMEQIEITEEQKETLTTAFTKILKASELLKDMTDSSMTKIINKITKKMLTRTHLLSLMPIAAKDDVTSVDIAMFSKKFFGTTKGTSINEIYNKYCGSGSAKADSVSKRLEAITASFDLYKTSITPEEEKAEIERQTSLISVPAPAYTTEEADEKATA